MSLRKRTKKKSPGEMYGHKNTNHESIKIYSRNDSINRHHLAVWIDTTLDNKHIIERSDNSYYVHHVYD